MGIGIMKSGLMSTAAASPSPVALPSPPLLHILHTNDFHNGLTDAGAARLRQVMASLDDAPCLLLDAGDAIKAGNVGVNPFGEPILDRMSDTGYQAMTMGNREFHVLHSALQTKISRARFPVLCANMRPRRPEGSPPLPVVPHVLLNPGGSLRVAVFGLTVPMVTERMKAAPLSQFLFDDPVKTARRMVEMLRPQADFLVALTHIGLREDQRLAREMSGIDLIIGGHSHVSLPRPEEVNGIPIVQAGSHARAYGHVTVTRDETGSFHIDGALHPLEEKKRL
jgi:5'-nucleotidase